MMIQAVLGNPYHPEYGVATIPFPIPHDQYAHCMELLEALEIGDAVKADCQVQEINSFYSVLKRMEMLTVNVEELNYLAKRLDSFDTGEAAQFQAVAHKLELFELKDLINLTFCCQQATVITDFSDLSAVGRNHYMSLHGGSAKMYAYLTKHRCIDRDVVTAFVQEKLLYEDDPHHNCVFVGLDENGEARHAHLRSTGSQGKVFRINVEGSDIKHSFHKNGTDRSLYVFEAPIDLLSHITLYPAGWLEHSYVACCGTSIQPVLERLRQNPKLDTVYLCLDNDEAGEDACDGMMDTLEDMGYDVERLRPEGKDWNDDLRAKRGGHG